MIEVFGKAEAMARLSAAYAAGGTPKFVRLLPTGDELWGLNEVALVVPGVPPDCPPALEYALRLRRDTLISGTCPRCGAVPTIQPPPHGFEGSDDVGIFGALFHHKVSCPGLDKTTERLLGAHRAALSERTAEEQFEVAQHATRERLAWMKDRPATDHLTSDHSLAFGGELLERLLTAASTCANLAADPVQQWNVLIAEGYWRCEVCLAYRFSEIKSGQGQDLGFPEEFCCDVCRRFAPNTLQPLVLRMDIFVMTGAMCGRCRPDFT